MKKICKKLLVLIVIVVSCVGVMTGCGASSGGTSSSNDKGKDTLAEAKEKGF